MTGKEETPGTDIEVLKPNQIQAAAMLAEGATFEEAGKAIQMNPQTLRGWAKNNQTFRDEIQMRAKESADRLQQLAVHARLDIMDLATEVSPTLREALEAVNAKGEPNWLMRLKAAELILKHGVTDKPDGQNDRAQASAAVLVITSDDVAVARKLTQDHGDVIDVEVVNEDVDKG